MAKFANVDKIFGRSREYNIKHEEELEQIVKAFNLRNSCSRLAVKKVKNGAYLLFGSRLRTLVVFAGSMSVDVVLQITQVSSNSIYTVNPYYLDRMVREGLLNPDHSINWEELDA